LSHFKPLTAEPDLINKTGFEIIHGGFNMLVLTRKAGEEIVIGDGIRVQVIEIRGGRVRLGITAPRSVPVHRSEVNINSNDTELVEVHCRAHRTG